MRCPFCYFDLTVPLESTRTKVKDSDLYAVDEKPVDARDLAHRSRFASFPCPICMAVLAIESKSQLGTQIVCPECEAFVEVPLFLQESYTEKERKAAELQQHHSGLAGLYDLSVDESADIYGVSDSEGAISSADVPPDGRFAVYCGLCNTMMYATEEMIGQTLTCSECERDVIVRRPEKPKPKSFRATSFEGATHYGAQDSPEIFEISKHFPNTRLVPVVCSLCETRMYAPETDIGTWKTCPDCDTKTEIKDVPEEERILPETTGSEYAVKEPPVAKRPTFRVGVDYRTIEGSLDLEHQRQLQKRLEQAEAAKKKKRPQDPQSAGFPEKPRDQPVELIAQKPFTPGTVPGAKPDAYDLQPALPRLVPKPPPLPEILSSDEPVSVPAGPRPELVHRQAKAGLDAPDKSDDPAAMENVRLRNRRALLRAEVAAVIYQRPHPPRHPFATRLFRPFFCHGFCQSLMTMILLGTIPVAAFTYAGPEGFRLFAGGIAGTGGVGAFQFLMLTAFGVVAGSYWIAFFVTYLFHFFAATSDGDDELGIRPEYSYIDGLFLTGRLVLTSFLAVLPGYLIWLLLHLFLLDWQGAELTFERVFKPVSDLAGGEPGTGRISFLFVTSCLLAHWIFHPIFFLSSCESESGGISCSSNTIQNLFRNPSLWLVFYGTVFPVAVFLSCYVYSYFLYGFYWESLFWSGVFFVSFLLAGSVVLTIYFRLLGRLAWVIEEESRTQPEPQS